MRPNTPHAVHTVEHSICRGGHCYAASTMLASEISIIQTFAADDILTNTCHDAAGLLVRRVLSLFHDILVLGKGSKSAFYPFVFS